MSFRKGDSGTRGTYAHPRERGRRQPRIACPESICPRPARIVAKFPIRFAAKTRCRASSTESLKRIKPIRESRLGRRRRCELGLEGGDSGFQLVVLGPRERRHFTNRLELLAADEVHSRHQPFELGARERLD